MSDAGRAISDLHTRRIHADYRMARTDVETRIWAQSACEIADDIIRELESFREMRPGAWRRRAILTHTLEGALVEISFLR